MSFDQVIKELKSKKYQPIYFLHGDEPYFMDQICDYIEGHVLNEGEKAFNQIILYGKDIDSRIVIDEARQFPMMSNLRVIIIKEAQDMKSLTDLLPYLEKPSATSMLVICYKYKKLDKRTKFAKILDEKALVFESKKLYDNQVADWAKRYILEKGYAIDQPACELMSEYIGADLSKLTNEIDKLLLNIPAGRPITVDDIREQIGISKDFDVFEFQKVLAEKNFVKAALIAKYFTQNPSANPSVVVVGSLFNYFNKIYITKFHASVSDQELSKLMGVNPFFMKEYKKAAGNYSISQLNHIMKTLKKADLNSKGVGSRSSDENTIYKDIIIACMGLSLHK
jgi:DNA polymerase-3 subunit delta